ncbi:SAF domain-containing protein [Amycolatopsis benzoatilytica]|uniref:SAF domain-containing protein n=1 Tax=Amycolatopsis benzoatilytica TaxID=346045 RepID=UPI000379AFCE|nr:SAF domain-containing protein [Amycolatopsis benzoatilytica]
MARSAPPAREPASDAGTPAWLDRTGNPAAAPSPRRRLPFLLTGALLVVGCVAGSLWWNTAETGRTDVLVIARPVPIGHLLAAGDLRTASVAVPGDVDTVAARDLDRVVGRPAATGLDPGTLLSGHSLGGPTTPVPGHAVAAVALKPGQVPPRLETGTTVTVVVTPPPPGAPVAAPAGTQWPAVVIDVQQEGTDQTTVVSLDLDAQDAPLVAQTPPGQLALVQVPAAGGR